MKSAHRRSSTSILFALLIVGSLPVLGTANVVPVAQAPAALAAAEPVKPAPAQTAIRINAGGTAAFTDDSGNVWLPEQGFTGGDTVDRGEGIAIANTKNPALYRTEHYDMSGFSCKVANGKYIVKLHFAETFEEITMAGQRVFSFTVEGHEFKDFDVFAKAGGAMRAYVETVAVDVADGKLDMTFTSKVENSEINAIEIIPAP